MINNFVDFYNMPETIFADGISWQKLDSNK